MLERRAAIDIHEAERVANIGCCQSQRMRLALRNTWLAHLMPPNTGDVLGKDPLLGRSRLFSSARLEESGAVEVRGQEQV
jgi:hypothetical protein